jgi:hypothetical protein
MVVNVGFAVGFAVVAPVKPAAGVQLYVTAPVGLIAVGFPPI